MKAQNQENRVVVRSTGGQERLEAIRSKLIRGDITRIAVARNVTHSWASKVINGWGLSVSEPILREAERLIAERELQN